jgi:sugar phosphate isomerase/epimerase
MKRDIPIAVQLYSVRKDCAERGLPAVLKEVAQMGYAGVEFAGLHNLSAKEVRKHLDDNGLKVAGTHTQLKDLFEDKLEETIVLNKELGNRFVICPYIPDEYRTTLDGWRKMADFFNGLVDRLAKEDMLIGYHNHTVEFVPVDGTLPWDVFYGNTRREVVMQLDTGNALHGGADVSPYIEKYPGRSLTVHLKEHSPTNKTALIGEGDVHWQQVFELCQRIGATEWYIVEQESYAHPPMECIKRCLENLRGMLAK